MRSQKDFDKAVALSDLSDRPRSLPILLEPLSDTSCQFQVSSQAKLKLKPRPSVAVR